MTQIMEFIQTLIEEREGWQDLDILPHRFGGNEFRSGKVEISHIHSQRMVDIPFNRNTRAALVESG